MCIDGSSTSMRSVSKPTNTIPVWRRCRSNASDHKRNGLRDGKGQSRRAPCSRKLPAAVRHFEVMPHLLIAPSKWDT